MAVYAVGDIQGCCTSLLTLLDEVSFDPAEDTLWCVGDLVNRGPESLATLRYLKGLGDACVCVLGNHDLHLLEQYAGGKAYHRDTLEGILQADDCDELIEWLRFKPLLHVDPATGWVMVHAGLHPGWSLKKAMKRARAVERCLQGEDWKRFCLELHHARFPRREPVKGNSDRELFSTAVFTRVRYCTENGLFNWDDRSGASRNSKDKAWFKHDALKWRDDCHVVFGHWAANGLVADQPHVLGLDTGCVWGSDLTLARLEAAGQYTITARIRCECKQPHS